MRRGKFGRKSFITWLSALLIISNLAFVGPAKADSLNVYGGVVTWPDKLYIPENNTCSNWAFSYKNSSGVELLLLGFILADTYGRKVEEQSEVGIKPEISGTWNFQVCSFDFKNGLGPYELKVYVKDYAGTQRESSKNVTFLTIPTSVGGGSSGGIASPTPTVTVTAKPSPAPTVTVTATPAPAPTVTVSSAPIVDPYFKNEATRLQGELSTLRSELNSVKAKLSKICKAKPKPKYC